MSKVRIFLRACMLLMLIGLGYGMFFGLFSSLNMDIWYEYALLMIIGILIHIFGISVFNSNINASFALVFSSFLLYGSAPTVWIGTLASLFSNGIANRGQSLRQTIFNGAQASLTITMAAYFYSIAGGLSENRMALENWFPLTLFVLSYITLNHIFVNFYLSTYSKKQRHWWKTALKWDLAIFALSLPAAIALTYIYFAEGLYVMLMCFVPLFFLQKLVQVYINLDLANKELRALYQVSKTMGTELDLQTTLKTILKEIQGVINYHTGVIYLYQQERGALLPKAIESPYANYFSKEKLYVGEGIVGLVAETKEAQLIDDVLEDPLFKDMPGLNQFLRSLMVVPMLVGNKVVGVIAIGSKNRGEYSDEQLRLLSILAGQGAVATANSLLYKRVGDMAVTDHLTKVYNHRFFYTKLEEEFNHCQVHQKELAIMLIDIDHFKRFNDRYGHLVGDMALNAVAKIIKAALTSRDTVARYGGEEFVVILPGSDITEAYQTAEKIRSQVENHSFKPKADYPPVRISVSIGLSTFPKEDNLKDLIHEADQAMYRAKQLGRNRIEISKN